MGRSVTEYNEGMTVGQIPHLHAHRHTIRHKAAVVEGSRRITWDELSDRTARAANLLASLGIGRGDKVSVILQNRLEYPELVYGIAGLGATIVPISYRFVADEIAYAISHSDSRAVIVDIDVLPELERAIPQLQQIDPSRILVVGSAAATSYADYETALQSAANTVDYLDQDEWDIYYLAFTGGTTGYPKACEVPHRIARQHWYDITVEVGIREDDVMLISGAFYHGLGFLWGLQQLMAGGTVVMQRTFDPREALQIIDRERVTFTPAAPTLYTMMLNVDGKEQYDVSTMRGLVSAGAPLMTSTKESMLDYFSSAGLWEYYGATEAGFYSLLRPADQRRKVRCAGQAWIGTELRILDESGEDVPSGTVGEIYKRGVALGARYYKNAAATRAALRDDWITSNDLGYLDDEGYLYVVDRAKDMIISGGVNIFPTEIEEVLASSPNVVECAVIGKPDETWGEIVVAYIVAPDGIEPSAEELDALCLDRLARYKRPREYVVVDALPKNPSGKILKRDLREQHA